MGIVYNRLKDKEKRQHLRNNATKAEKKLWEHIRGRSLDGYKFRRQYGVDHFVVDFYCPDLKLAIEVDGGSHLEDGAEEYDKYRQDYIEQFGIHFLRFYNNEIFEDLYGVLQKIRREMKKLNGIK